MSSQPGGNMFGNDQDNKNKIEQLEDKVSELENKIANIMDVLELQDEEESDEFEPDDGESEDL